MKLYHSPCSPLPWVPAAACRALPDQREGSSRNPAEHRVRPSNPLAARSPL